MLWLAKCEKKKALYSSCHVSCDTHTYTFHLRCCSSLIHFGIRNASFQHHLRESQSRFSLICNSLLYSGVCREWKGTSKLILYRLSLKPLVSLGKIISLALTKPDTVYTISGQCGPLLTMFSLFLEHSTTKPLLYTQSWFWNLKNRMAFYSKSSNATLDT